MGAETEEVELEITQLGSGGDGLARHGGKTFYVPLAAPGDVVRVRPGPPRGQALHGEIVRLVEPGPARAEAPCLHFGVCGGCRVQHLETRAYDLWKRGILETALRQRGFEDASVAPTLKVPPATRRRARLAAEAGRERVRLGFRERASHRIAEIGSCLVLEPSIMALLPELRDALAHILAPRESIELTLSRLEDGLDLVLEAKREPSLSEREALAAFAKRADLARVSWRTGRDAPEAIAYRRAGMVRFGGVPVVLPPGSFLQATAEAEAILSGLVRNALPAGATRLADLYSGAGAFAFPLAAGASVLAVDGDAASIAALEAAARKANLYPRLRGLVRDLERQPLTAAELEPFDAVLFDPPRGGAARQAKELAKSRTPLVLALSCNPASFARDARLLSEGGYVMGPVHPVDQFLFTPYLEVFAAFRKAR